MIENKFQIYNSSSENMSDIANDSIDLAVMDPPFNIGLSYEKSIDDTSNESYFKLIDNVIKETKRVLKPAGLALILLPERIKKQGVLYNYPEIYSSICGSHNFKYLDLFSFKVSEEDFSCVAIDNLGDADTPGNSHTQEMKGLVFGKLHRMLKRFPNGRQYNYVQKETHPCPFPQELVKDILDTYFISGNKVLEQFMGTAGLGAEVLKMGGVYRGYEINQNYFKIAQKKLAMAGVNK